MNKKKERLYITPLPRHHNLPHLPRADLNLNDDLNVVSDGNEAFPIGWMSSLFCHVDGDESFLGNFSWFKVLLTVALVDLVNPW